MNTFFFSLLIIFSLFILMKLGKIRASSKQTQRNDRINWFNSKESKDHQDLDGSKNIEGKPEEINEKSL